MKYAPIAALSFIGLLTSVAGAQQSQPSSTAELRAEIDALRARLDQLDETTAERNRIEFSGDLRYRHETINDDAAPGRNRHRIRARINLGAELGDDLTVGITLATGGSNPVSGNQSLDGGFTRKDIGFDRAFFAWDINEELTLEGGKFGNPMFRPGGNHLIFDSDLNTEGLALSYDGGGNGVFANIGGFWVEERSGGNDAILYALQGGYRMMIGNGATLRVGGSVYNYQDTQGFIPFYLGNPQGNTLDGFGNLATDYDLVELFAQVDLEAGGEPLRLFFDYVENTEANNFETGFALGFRWRSASNPGDWELGWSYEDLEADAVIATFTDSDFGGGGTDAKGHILRGAYRLRDNVRLNGTYFINERGEAAGNPRDYDRLQLDINFMF